MKNFIKYSLFIIGIYIILKFLVVPLCSKSIYEFSLEFSPFKNDILTETGIGKCKLVEDIDWPISLYVLTLINKNDTKFKKSQVIIIEKMAYCQIQHSDGMTFPIYDSSLFYYHPFVISFKRNIYNRNYCGEQIRSSCVFNEITSNPLMYNDKYISKVFDDICNEFKLRGINNYESECDIF